jgi:type VI secretion system protein ImpA
MEANALIKRANLCRNAAGMAVAEHSRVDLRNALHNLDRDMNIDIAALLEPVAPDSPCGDDLEYDSEFLEMESAAAGKPEQQVGDTIVPAEEPDWRNVAARALGLLARTRDLRVACRLAQAMLHTQGIAGLRDGLSVVRGYLDSYWDALYPRLDPDDSNDPAIRVNTVASLCHAGRVINPLRDTRLVAARGQEPVSARTIAIVRGNEAPPPGGERNLPTTGEIEAMFMECDFAELRHTAEAAAQACALVGEIEAGLTRRVGSAKSVDMSALADALSEARGILAQWIERRLPAQTGGSAVETAQKEATGSVSQAAAQDQAVQARGPICGRDDVVRSIDEICSYFEQHEPSSAVPILLTRARRWVTMDFIAVLHDMAPDAAKEAERLRGAFDSA